MCVICGRNLIQTFRTSRLIKLESVAIRLGLHLSAYPQLYAHSSVDLEAAKRCCLQLGGALQILYLLIMDQGK